MRFARRPDPLLLDRTPRQSQIRPACRARALAAVAVWSALLLAMPLGLASGAALAPAEYARRLDGAAQQLDRAARAGQARSRLAKEALAGVPERATVRPSPSAPAISVDNRTLLADLTRRAKSGRAGIGQAAQRLRSLRAGITAEGPAPPDGRQALAKVLAGRAFRPSLWQRVRQKLSEAGGRAVRYLVEHLPAAPAHMRVPAHLWRIVGYAVLFCAGIVVVLLVARLVLRLTSPPRPGTAALALDDDGPIRPHGEWLAEAERHLQAGRYGAAVRAVYLASLMRLDETGHLSYDRARADGRFVRALELKGEADLARQLLGLSGLFSRIWYGLAPAGAPEYDAARQLWTQLEARTAP